MSRHWSHKKYAFKLNSSWPFHRAIRKYGWENFQWDILEICHNEIDANEMEKYLISLTKDFHYNLTKGGEGASGYRHTPEVIQNMRNRIGALAPRFGAKNSPETNRKISEGRKGKIASTETKYKLSLSKKGSKNPRAKSIVDNYGNIYPTLVEAALATKVSKQQIYRLIRSGKSSRSGISYTFAKRGE
jgi:group I intron endonuclease